MGAHLKSVLKKAGELPKGERKLLARAIEDWIRDAERAEKRKTKGKAGRKRRRADFEATMPKRYAETAAPDRPLGKKHKALADAPAPRGVALDRWSAGVADLRWEDYFPAS